MRRVSFKLKSQYSNAGKITSTPVLDMQAFSLYCQVFCGPTEGAWGEKGSKD